MAQTQVITFASVAKRDFVRNHWYESIGHMYLHAHESQVMKRIAQALVLSKRSLLMYQADTVNFFDIMLCTEVAPPHKPRTMPWC